MLNSVLVGFLGQVDLEKHTTKDRHIKTHLWDLSTNLSKLNIFLKLKNIVLYES